MKSSWKIFLFCEFLAVILSMIFMGDYLAGYFLIDYVVVGFIIVIVYNYVQRRKKKRTREK